jgi:hypothetical protein
VRTSGIAMAMARRRKRMALRFVSARELSWASLERGTRCLTAL